MADGQVVDADALAERIREGIRRRREQVSLADTHSARTTGQCAVDLAVLRSGYDIYGVPLSRSHRTIVGPAIHAAKEVVRKLLTPILLRQVAHNAAATRVLAHLNDQLSALGDQVSELGDRLAALGDQLTALKHEQARVPELLKEPIDAIERQARRLDGLEEQDRRQTTALAAVRERASSAERRLRRLAHDLRTDPATAHGPDRARASGEGPEPEFDYFCFEERFRGTTEEIKERQRAYLPYVQGCGNVLDVGCGRGEFLELLRETGIPARGIDTNLDMVLYCRERDLDVTQTDALSYLGSLPDGSLGGIFCAQVIEHLDFQTLMNLVTLGHQKLLPEAPIILETLNPQSVDAMNAFYLDPSHVKPIHPEMVRFLLESTGFRDVQIRYSGPDPGGGEGAERTDEWRRLHCQDYAVIARR
jgi:O-antigen chain-terminating methyltransferase